MQGLQILNAISCPITAVDWDKKIIIANSAMQRLIGKVEAGSNYHSVFGPDESLDICCAKKEDVLNVSRVIGDRDFLVDYRLYKNDRGKPAGVLISMQSNSLASDWLMAALDAIPDAILLCDKNHVVKYINSSYTNLKGLGWSDIVGKKINEVRSGKLIPAVVDSGIPINNLYRQFNEAKFTVDITPIMRADRIVGGVSISKDLGQIKEIINSCNHAIATLKEGKGKKSQTINKEDDFSFKNIIGRSLTLLQALEKSKIAAKVNSNVLILGETGTGKELFAHAIHNGGERKGCFFVAINCAAIPQELMESELFGYEGGAFTGANNQAKIGLFELANEGTIFLDEIGEMSLALQSKLLRVLENRTIRRVGGLKEIPIDVRVIAATNRNLESMVARGEFREDLYYRLNVFPVSIPPLRERTGDIPLLARYFIKQLSGRLGKKVTLTEESLSLLQNYEWPGNVRELENALEYAVNLVDSPLIEPGHFPPVIYNNRSDSPKSPDMDLHGLVPLADLERQAVKKAILHFGTTTDGKKAAAKFLGVSLTTLYKKIKDYQLVGDKFQ